MLSPTGALAALLLLLSTALPSLCETYTLLHRLEPGTSWQPRARIHFAEPFEGEMALPSPRAPQTEDLLGEDGLKGLFEQKKGADLGFYQLMLAKGDVQGPESETAQAPITFIKEASVVKTYSERGAQKEKLPCTETMAYVMPNCYENAQCIGFKERLGSQAVIAGGRVSLREYIHAVFLSSLGRQRATTTNSGLTHAVPSSLPHRQCQLLSDPSRPAPATLQDVLTLHVLRPTLEGASSSAAASPLLKPYALDYHIQNNALGAAGCPVWMNDSTDLAQTSPKLNTTLRLRTPTSPFT